MSLKPPESESLLAPIAERYKPSAADFERMTTKIDAAIARGGKSTASPAGTSLRWIGASCVVILAVGVATRMLSTHSSTSAELHEVESSAVEGVVGANGAANGIEASQSPASTSVVPVVSIDALPHAPVAASSAAMKPSASPAPEGDTLAREAKLLVGAESAFRRGDDARALAFLETHAKEFPNGVLKDERTAERIVVLCHAGRVDEATREGRVFLRARGSDPLARRVALSCAGTAADEGAR